jgi:hypothetical protein
MTVPFERLAPQIGNPKLRCCYLLREMLKKTVMGMPFF